MSKFIILAIFILSASSPRVEVKVSRAFCNPPCTQIIMVRVPKDADNRHLVVQIDGTQLQASTIPLQGMEAPVLHEFTFKNLPVGDYDVVAILYQTEREVARSKTTFKVVGPEPHKGK